MKKDELAQPILDTLRSPNVLDANFEAANVVDSLAMVASALTRLHPEPGSVTDALFRISDAMYHLADVLEKKEGDR